MYTRHFIVGMALLLLPGTAGAADTHTHQLHCHGAGTNTPGVETHLDVNGDGASATLAQGLENCNIGRFVFQQEAEWIPQHTLTNCPVGTGVEYHILFPEPGYHPAPNGQAVSTATNERTGDQLFTQYTEATFCLNVSAIPFTFTAWGHTAIFGGTGKYADVTGTGEFHTAGSYLAFGVKDGIPGAFGQFTFTSDGTLTLPHAGED